MRKLYLILIIAFTGLCTYAFPDQDNQLTKQEKKTIQNEIKQLKKDLENLNKDTSTPSNVKDRLRERYENSLLLLEEALGTISLKEIESSDLSHNDMTSANNSYSDSQTSTQNTSSDGIKETNSKDEIVLTVTSDGATKDEAVKNALRSAIEQSYGAFVSANTTILNDELVKDEIITVTNGAIKDYSELSSVLLSSGRYNVTITATVSLPHLITYAKNHGSECEFAGNEFGLNIRLFEIEKQNELKALYNLIPYLKELAKNCMEWKLVVDQPKLIDFKYELNEHENYALGEFFSSEYRNSNNGHTIEFNENISGLLNNFLQNNRYEKDEGTLAIMEMMPSDQYAVIKFDVVWEPNSIEYKRLKEENRRSEELLNNNPVVKAFRETVNSLSLDSKSYNHLKDQGYNVTYFQSFLISEDHYSCFRNSPKDIAVWFDRLVTELNNIKNNFVIVDNTGQISDFAPVKLANLKDWSQGGFDHRYFESIDFLSEEERNALEDELMDGVIIKKYEDYPEFCRDLCYDINTQYCIPYKIKKFQLSDFDNGSWDFTCLGSTGILSNLFFIKAPSRFEDRTGKIFTCFGSDWEIYVLLPKSEISKYASFKIEPNDN
ncbi:MAG: hypothetical protein J1F07_04045 [Muribaculaceae bacterium]|nr:hypothetical protein [Muribaculaceae bacterium]